VTVTVTAVLDHMMNILILTPFTFTF